MTLTEAIRSKAGAQAPALIKHLSSCGLNEWGDLTTARLNDLKDSLEENVARSSARTYMAVLKSIMARYEDEFIIPCRSYRDILRTRNEKPLKTYLTADELDRLERVPVMTSAEQYVLDEFLIGARTGMRVSDSRVVSKENIVDGCLTYVSQKTGVTATIPVGERTVERIERVVANGSDLTLTGYNKIIRRLCKRAGITEPTKVFKAGKHICKPKCELISSHTARISFCTNLARLKVPILDISRLAGHTNVGMTYHYIVPTAVELNDRAMEFLNK